MSGGRQPGGKAERHPARYRLGRFMRGELSRAEVAGIVRHLVTGCPRCVEVTRKLWRRGEGTRALKVLLEALESNDRPLAGAQPGEMTEAEAAAQAELRSMVLELEALRSRLAEMHDKLPVPPEETAMLLGEKEMDVATEVRSVIECVLNDRIEPAIRDLAAAASYRPPP
jgi:hypothetical protein